MWNGDKKGANRSKRSTNLKQSVSIIMTAVTVGLGGQQSVVVEPNRDYIAMVTIKHTRSWISGKWPKGKF